MHDRTEALLRKTLGRHPIPELSATMAADTVKLVQALQAADQRRAQLTRRLLLGTYWSAATIASLWILWSIPWPQWKPSSLSAFSAWFIPLGFAAVIWYASIIDWFTSWSTRLLQPYAEADPKST
jgi:hypothetical protein